MTTGPYTSPKEKEKGIETHIVTEPENWWIKRSYEMRGTYELLKNAKAMNVMNDDITSREIELVNSLLSALQENDELFLIQSVNEDEDQKLTAFQNGYSAGYNDALCVVEEVLLDRGFDIEVLKIHVEDVQ